MREEESILICTIAQGKVKTNSPTLLQDEHSVGVLVADFKLILPPAAYLELMPVPRIPAGRRHADVRQFEQCDADSGVYVARRHATARRGTEGR